MVEQIETAFDFSRITPAFIYNRIDLFSPNYRVLHVQGDQDFYLEVQLFDHHAELGVWMMPVSDRDLDDICQFIFSHYKSVDYILFSNAISDRVYVAKTHYDVVLPDTADLLKKRLSAKSRNTMSRKRKKAEADYGPITMMAYENDKITDTLLSTYFLMKEKTHHRDYQMTRDEYLSRYHVSNAYVLNFGERCAAIILTCEQCPIAYLENLTYDMELSKYSPGMMAYEMVLERLIAKGKTHFFLGGGHYDYKKKYDSVETHVTDGKIYRSWVVALTYRIGIAYHKFLFLWHKIWIFYQK